MPEYLAPGVYVEEVSFRQKTIEGVSTSTAGFVGAARFGVTSGEPALVTNLSDFERYFHGLDALSFADDAQAQPNFLAQAVRAFFEEGGRRLYISRVFRPLSDDATVNVPANQNADGVARLTLTDPRSPGTDTILVRARHPGSGGNLTVRFIGRISDNVLGRRPLDPANLTGPQESVLRGVQPFDLVRVVNNISPAATAEFCWAEYYFDPALNRMAWRFNPDSGAPIPLAALDPTSGDEVHIVSLAVEVLYLGAPPESEVQRRDLFDGLAFHPAHPRAVQTVFAANLPNREEEMAYPIVVVPTGNLLGPRVARILLGQPRAPTERLRLIPRLGLTLSPLDVTTDLSVLGIMHDDRVSDADRTYEARLTGGNDGLRPRASHFEGQGANSPATATGLRAFEHVEDISIVAAPGSTFRYAGPYRNDADQIVRLLISHCERMRYRVCLVDAPDNTAIAGIRAFRSAIDSTHAALYYPWIEILDPVRGEPLLVPPSGAMAGICARNDIERGVHKAPANEVIRTAIGLEQMLNKAHQDVLNPEGINCLRSFEGRGIRVWGARTATSDSEWKYLNLRRYFAYLERSIERATQWAVFEPNGPKLWKDVRLSVEDFLYSEWQNNRLFGLNVGEAFFVRCDRTTMSANDIDNGRMVCLIGVSPLRPAEFVIFRIGQWTADRRS
ncbi:MAG: phage tail sheath subtilisin-like domain-containing protein [Deltaproteobacteria bacterium]|nr:phage tail sheath subtilisin-like domain-containing protein [Deltaproteobacteria bacterium]